MTGLLVIIIVLLIVLIVWALGITVLYAQMARTIKRITASDADAIHAVLDCNTWMTQLLRETLDSTEAMHKLVIEYTDRINVELEKNAENKRFAMDTIQQARRLYNSIQQNIQPEIIEEEEQNG